MNNIEFCIENENYGFPAIELIIDGIVRGSFEVANEGFGSFRIENVVIDSEYRGKGFYKMLIIAAFNMFSIDTLRSDNRNEKSNPCYEKWCGQDLCENETVFIQRDGEQLIFTVDAYVED